MADADRYVRPMDLHIHAPNGECEEMGCINITRLQRLTAEGGRKDAVIEAIQTFINAQAEDEGLWCEAQYASEAHIQRALRGCHAYIESVIKDGPRPESTLDDEGKQKKVEVELTPEAEDAIIVESLRDHLEYQTTDGMTHKKDSKEQKELVKSFEMILDYYGGP